jgi:hypothetical protein
LTTLLKVRSLLSKGTFPLVGAFETASKAHEASARLAEASKLDGVNTTVTQLTAELGNSQWETHQMTVRAPSDRYVTVMALTLRRSRDALIYASRLAMRGVPLAVIAAQLEEKLNQAGQDAHLRPARLFRIFSVRRTLRLPRRLLNS